MNGTALGSSSPLPSSPPPPFFNPFVHGLIQGSCKSLWMMMTSLQVTQMSVLLRLEWNTLLPSV